MKRLMTTLIISATLVRTWLFFTPNPRKLGDFSSHTQLLSKGNTTRLYFNATSALLNLAVITHYRSRLVVSNL